jgi:hypothetical protein
MNTIIRITSHPVKEGQSGNRRFAFAESPDGKCVYVPAFVANEMWELLDGDMALPGSCWTVDIKDNPDEARRDRTPYAVNGDKKFEPATQEQFAEAKKHLPPAATATTKTAVAPAPEEPTYVAEVKPALFLVRDAILAGLPEIDVAAIELEVRLDENVSLDNAPAERDRRVEKARQERVAEADRRFTTVMAMEATQRALAQAALALADTGASKTQRNHGADRAVKVIGRLPGNVAETDQPATEALGAGGE